MNNIQIKDNSAIVRLANLTSYHSFALNYMVKLFKSPIMKLQHITDLQHI